MRGTYTPVLAFKLKLIILLLLLKEVIYPIISQKDKPKACFFVSFLTKKKAKPSPSYYYNTQFYYSKAQILVEYAQI